MSVVEQLIDVDALIPDGIEPVEALRCWNFDGSVLTSLTNGEVWTPGEALVARCTASDGKTYSWNIVRRGMTYEQAFERASWHNQTQTMFWSPYGRTTTPTHIPYPTKVALPDGYGFELVEETHDSPHENCTCGIYAATTKKQLPDSGHVYGKAKLWGKVVPGERGVRAQFAYPSEFHVHPSMLDNPALKAFGVPLIEKAGARVPTPVGGIAQFISTNIGAAPSASRTSRSLRWAMAANVGATALNLSLVGLHVFH